MLRVASLTAFTTGLVETKIKSGDSATISVAAARMRSVLSPVNR